MIKITILIPTYNRCYELEKTINIFNDEINRYNLSDKVKILIGNNASSDNTLNFLKNNNSKNILYYTNRDNLGITKNILCGIKKLKSEYVWIFGDDDIPAKGVLNEIIVFLEKNIVDYIWMPSKDFHTEEDIDISIARNVNFNKFTFKEEFIKNSKNIDRDSGFITSHIIKVSLINEVIAKYKEYKEIENNNYFNKLIIYNVLSRNISLFKIDGKIVFKRVGNGSYFSNDIESIKKTYIDDINCLYPHYKELGFNLYSYIKENNSKRYLIYILIRILHKNSQPILTNEYKIYGNLYLILIRHIPKNVLLMMYLFYKNIRKTKHPIVLKKTLNEKWIDNT